MSRLIQDEPQRAQRLTEKTGHGFSRIGTVTLESLPFIPEFSDGEASVTFSSAQCHCSFSSLVIKNVRVPSTGLSVAPSKDQ